MIAGTEAVFAERQLKWLDVLKAYDSSPIRSDYNRQARSGPLVSCTNVHFPGRVSGIQDLTPRLCCSNATDNQLIVFHPAYHVHIDHGDCVCEWHDWMVDVVIGTEQSFFLATECNEH